MGAQLWGLQGPKGFGSRLPGYPSQALSFGAQDLGPGFCEHQARTAGEKSNEGALLAAVLSHTTAQNRVVKSSRRRPGFGFQGFGKGINVALSRFRIGSGSSSKYVGFHRKPKASQGKHKMSQKPT